MWKIEIPAAKGFSLLRRMFLNNVSSFARKNVDFYVSEESLRFSKLMFCIFIDVKLQSLEFGKNLAFVSFFFAEVIMLSKFVYFLLFYKLVVVNSGDIT